MFYRLNSIRLHHKTVDLKSLGPRLHGFESRRPHQKISKGRMPASLKHTILSEMSHPKGCLSRTMSGFLPW